jgi:hypothetical protein
MAQEFFDAEWSLARLFLFPRVLADEVDQLEPVPDTEFG